MKVKTPYRKTKKKESSILSFDVNTKEKNKQTVICNQCTKEFIALVSEVKLGKAKFCSHSCAGMYGTNKKLMKTRTCKQCSKSFTTKSNKATFCSNSCKSKHSAVKRKVSPEDIDLVKSLRKRPCELCGWREGSRDIHHVKPVKDGGPNTPINLITLCPNHHRLADQGILMEEDLFILVGIRVAKIGY